MNTHALEPTRMTAEEADLVMRVWQERQGSEVGVCDLAEALAAPPSEVEAILWRIRAEQRGSVRKSRNVDVLNVVGLFGMLATAGLVIAMAVREPMLAGSTRFWGLFAMIAVFFVPSVSFWLLFGRKREPR